MPEVSQRQAAPAPEGVGNIRVTRLTEAELSAVAAIHLAAFPESALTKLGHGAVERYYEWQLTGPHECVALGARLDGRLAGFCFAGVFRGALGGFLRRNRIYLAGQVLLRPWLLGNPLFRERLGAGWKSLRRAMRRTPSRLPSVPGQATERAFGILAIAVDPLCGRAGVGRCLMSETEKEAVGRGFATMSLSVNADNTAAIRFYEKLHWKPVLKEGSWSGQMSKQLKV